MTNRRGFSLIEMVAAMGVISILAGLSVTLIHSLLRVERLERASLVQQNTLVRLSREFRQDVHSAQILEPSGNEAGPIDRIVLQSAPDATVQYQIKNGLIVRSSRYSERVERTKNFELPSGARAHLVVSGKRGQTMVSLFMDRKAGKRGEGKVREFRVEAHLGRDHRFVAAGE